jgi:signal transduction histidine kinase
VTVSQRLYLAVVPAILGVFTVAGLAYWGEYGRQAPHILVIVAIVASVGSLVVAWRNTRYVATRVSRLAAPAQVTRTDELDAIEGEVERLRQAVIKAEATAAQARDRAAVSVQEYGGLVADAAAAAARQLDEIRMPLHILLDNHFGDLNDNQEEMLAAARLAADDAQAYLERLRAIADIEQDAVRLRIERIRLADIVTARLPGLSAAAARVGVRVSTDLSPRLPAIMGDRRRLGEALALLIGDAVHRTPSGGEVLIIGADPDLPLVAGAHGAATGGAGPGQPSAPNSRAPAATARLVLLHGSGTPRATDAALADRLVAVQGGTVHHEPDRTIVEMPSAVVGSVPAR